MVKYRSMSPWSMACLGDVSKHGHLNQQVRSGSSRSLAESVAPTLTPGEAAVGGFPGLAASFLASDGCQ